MIRYRHRKRKGVYKLVGLVEFRAPTDMHATEGEVLHILQPIGKGADHIFAGIHQRYYPEAVLMTEAELQSSSGRIENGEPLVVYLCITTGKTWARPPEEFFDTKRFERLSHFLDDQELAKMADTLMKDVSEPAEESELV